MNTRQNNIIARHQANIGIVAESITKNNYELNIDKALYKKLKATKRVQNIVYEQKGGGMVVTADTATFELFKHAVTNYFQNFPCENGCSSQTTSTDRTGSSVVQITIKVDKGNEREYTINMYTTTSKFLVNGKNAQVFMNRDMKAIQEIIKKATSDNKEEYIKNLNEKMAEQLNKILQNSTAESSIIKKNEDFDNINCLKCKKRCRTKGTYCTKGKHWIHYNCERLSNDEIKAIEDIDNDDYTCKMCHNTTPVRKVLAIETIQSTCTTSAESILSEGNDHRSDETSHEQDELNDMQNVTQCNVCDGTLTDLKDVCDICNNPCHPRCLSTQKDNNICITCTGHNDQIDMANNTQIDELEIDEETAKKTVRSSLKNANKGTQSSTTNDKQIEELKNKEKSQSTSNITMSSTQLRQKELKLKRWEDDLRLKEKLVNEHEKDHAKLRSYIAKLENKNHENSLHIQTLQTRIEQIECQPARKANDHQFSHYKNTDINQKTAGNINLMNSIQDRVTTFILKKIDSELSELESQLLDRTTCQRSDNSPRIETGIQTDLEEKTTKVNDYETVKQKLDTTTTIDLIVHAQNDHKEKSTSEPKRRVDIEEKADVSQIPARTKTYVHPQNLIGLPLFMTNRNNVTSGDKRKHNQRITQNINFPPLRSEGNKKHKSYDKHTTDQYQSNVNKDTVDETTRPINQSFLSRAQMTMNLQ